MMASSAYASAQPALQSPAQSPAQSPGQSPASEPATRDGRPSARGGSAETLEKTRPSLSDVTRRRATNPSAENERLLADEYIKHGILDAAYDHFQAALRLDVHDARSNEGVARIWRDWGFSNMGLSSAYRAVYWSPESASAHNTLGTLLLKLGFVDAARDRFERARQLDPDAAYPLNNLCYLLLGSGRAEEAVDMCRAALATDASSDQVRNNLALALASAGDLEGALAALASGPEAAVAAYNEGVLLVATRHPERARAALTRSRISDPGFAPALRLLTRLSAGKAGH